MDMQKQLDAISQAGLADDMSAEDALYLLLLEEAMDGELPRARDILDACYYALLPIGAPDEMLAEIREARGTIEDADPWFDEELPIREHVMAVAMHIAMIDSLETVTRLSQGDREMQRLNEMLLGVGYIWGLQRPHMDAEVQLSLYAVSLYANLVLPTVMSPLIALGSLFHFLLLEDGYGVDEAEINAAGDRAFAWFNQFDEVMKAKANAPW